MKLERHVLLMGSVGVVAICMMVVMLFVVRGPDGGLAGKAAYLSPNMVKNPSFENDCNMPDYYPNTDSDDLVMGNEYPNGWWYLDFMVPWGVKRVCSAGVPPCGGPCGNGEPNADHYGGCCSYKLPRQADAQFSYASQKFQTAVGPLNPAELCSQDPNCGALVKVSARIRVDTVCAEDPLCYGSLRVAELPSAGDQIFWGSEFGNGLAALPTNHVKKTDRWELVEYTAPLSTNYIDQEGHSHWTAIVEVLCMNTPENSNGNNPARGTVYCDDISFQIYGQGSGGVGDGGSPFNVKLFTRAQGLD